MVKQIKRIAVCTGFFLGCAISTAHASVITLDAVDSGTIFGSFRSPSASNLAGSALYTHYNGLAGSSIGAAYTGGSTQQGFTSEGTAAYVIFDSLQSQFVVSGASLQIDLLDSEFPEGTLSINDIDSILASDLFALRPGSLSRTQGSSLTTDFQTGVNFGGLALNTPTSGSGLYNIALNAAALDLINSTEGLLPLSLYFRPSDTAFPGAGMTFRSTPKLILTGEFLSVPEPGTLTLLLLGTCLVMFRRQTT